MEKTKFKLNEQVAYSNGYWTNPVDEHLIVWYQMETLNDFSKLYGRLNGTLKGGLSYRIKIKFNYQTDALDTDKFIIFSENGQFGSDSEFLAWVFIGAACYSLVLACLMVFGQYHQMFNSLTKDVDNEEYFESLKF
jgi:hypothetical protein